MFSAFPDRLDPFEYLAITSEEVKVHVRPSTAAPVLATLSHELVKKARSKPEAKISPEDHRRWLKIITPRGQAGYILAKQARSPVDCRAGFRKIIGRWVMVALLAGD